jgi:hypothetical protein
MGFRRSLVRIQSPRHSQGPPGLQVLAGLLFRLETALQDTLQETGHLLIDFSRSRGERPFSPGAITIGIHTTMGSRHQDAPVC